MISGLAYGSYIESGDSDGGEPETRFGKTLQA